jgi:hypothetical protein
MSIMRDRYLPADQIALKLTAFPAASSFFIVVGIGCR